MLPFPVELVDSALPIGGAYGRSIVSASGVVIDGSAPSSSSSSCPISSKSSIFHNLSASSCLSTSNVEFGPGVIGHIGSSSVSTSDPFAQISQCIQIKRWKLINLESALSHNLPLSSTK